MTARQALHTLILAMLAGSACRAGRHGGGRLRRGAAWRQSSAGRRLRGRQRAARGGQYRSGAKPRLGLAAAGPAKHAGVFYDGASITQLSERPVVMLATVAWFYAQPRVSETNGQPYGSVTQAVIMNCSNNTYTVTETQHYAGPNATGSWWNRCPWPACRARRWCATRCNARCAP